MEKFCCRFPAPYWERMRPPVNEVSLRLHLTHHATDMWRPFTPCGPGRGSIHHFLLVLPSVYRFLLCPQWSKYHNLSIKVTDLYTISTPWGCCSVQPLLIHPGYFMTPCWSQAHCICKYVCFWEGRPLDALFSICATLEKSSTANLPLFRTTQGPWLCLSLLFDSGQKFA